MRIKRQRRKLRGKYSGNCLSCNAKWSKCWYIASAENREEWETRLHTRVTPADDEVCFQCWDAKIRTSPKRKMHFKAEIPTFDAILADAIPYLRPSKRTDNNKRRALNMEGSMYSRPTAVYVSNLNDSKQRYSEDDEDNELVDETDMDSNKNSPQEDDELYEEGVEFEEESAVILLSTGFRTISPDQIYVNVDIDVHAEDVDGAELDAESGDDLDGSKLKKRGAYYCGKCGKLKKGHVCPSPSPSLSSSAELFASGSGSPSPTRSSTHGALLAILQSAEFQLEDEDTVVMPSISVLPQPVASRA